MGGSYNLRSYSASSTFGGPTVTPLFTGDVTLRVMALAAALQEFLPYCETYTREEEQWIQCRYKFPNGYGASVVQGNYTYGAEDGLYELAVVSQSKEAPDEWHIDYRTRLLPYAIGYGAIGRVNIDQIRDLLRQIQAKRPKRHRRRARRLTID